MKFHNVNGLQMNIIILTGNEIRHQLDFSASKFYVENKNLKLMFDNGMVIGLHTLNHPEISKLSFNEQYKQISVSFKYLQDLNIENDKNYCHPYGGFYSFYDDTVYILKKENVLYSFNV
jgi:hypothetical protein